MDPYEDGTPEKIEKALQHICEVQKINLIFIAETHVIW